MITDPDPWPLDVPRTWMMTMQYKGLDGKTMTKVFVAREVKRCNENFMHGLLEQCLQHHGGWVLNPTLTTHFQFDEMPPAGAKMIAFERIDEGITEMQEQLSQIMLPD